MVGGVSSGHFFHLSIKTRQRKKEKTPPDGAVEAQPSGRLCVRSTGEAGRTSFLRVEQLNVEVVPDAFTREEWLTAGAAAN
jgi:hypothetical protein